MDGNSVELTTSTPSKSGKKINNRAFVNPLKIFGLKKESNKNEKK